MGVMKERDGRNYVVSPEEQNQVLSSSDIEMDARARQAIKAAIEKVEFCKKSVARYDIETKRRILNMRMERESMLDKELMIFVNSY